MCTLAVALHADPHWPLIAATNRDERLGRPAEDWAIRRPPAGPAYLAPLDAVAGGTWIGISAWGLFAALTNFHAGPPFPDPLRTSRGLLVLRALSRDSVAGAWAELRRTDPSTYNPFHLVVADVERAFLWRYDGRSATFHDLAPGLHVITESDHAGGSARAERVRARWPARPDPAALREVLAQHADSPRDGTCIHLDPHYGTRSSAVVRLAPALAWSSLSVANGRPCTTPLEDRSSLLAELARQA